jgi:hypothetical protein
MKQAGFRSKVSLICVLVALAAGGCERSAAAKSTSGSAPEPAAMSSADVPEAKRQAGCGNAHVDPGEACDGARIVKTGSAAADRQGCSADCKTVIADDLCEKCQNEKCTRYQGVNLVAGCFDALDTTYGARAGDGEFLSDCTAVVNCALAHGCGTSGAGQGARCYCGSASLDECAKTGPAGDAPCAKEWLKAARTQKNDELQMRFTDLVYPAGWAHALLDCYGSTEQCAASCGTK